MQARYHGDKCACCRSMYCSWPSESPESLDESDDVSYDMSCKRRLQIFTFLLCIASEPNRFCLELKCVLTGSPIELRRILCSGVMHGVSCGVAACSGVASMVKLAGDLLTAFLADLLLDFVPRF